MAELLLPERRLVVPPGWMPAKLHPKQYAYLHCNKRINYVACGRRSFKTQAAMRRLALRAMKFSAYPDGRFFLCAPVQEQAEHIFWEGIKALIPDEFILGGRHNGIWEGKHMIELINGAKIRVVGLDKPSRVEGKDWDGGVITEYGDCKPDVFGPHIRPMMMRGGYIDIEGVPEGHNHFYREVMTAKDDIKRNGDKSEYSFHHWKTSEVLHLWLGREKAAAELAHAMATLDLVTYRQEYDASFVEFVGLVYYAFNADLHANERVHYNPNLPVCICFDFNVEPGVAVYLQEQVYRGKRSDVSRNITAAVGEIYIPRNSNTPTVCRKVLADFERGPFKNHTGEVHLHGDPQGGQRSTKTEAGSDWDIIEAYLKPVFGSRLKNYVAIGSPPVRPSVNAVNARLQTADGMIHMLIDAVNCPRLRDDFESVSVKEGTDGEINKEDTAHTHLTDAVRYYMHEEHPLQNPNESKTYGA